MGSFQQPCNPQFWTQWQQHSRSQPPGLVVHHCMELPAPLGLSPMRQHQPTQQCCSNQQQQHKEGPDASNLHCKHLTLLLSSPNPLPTIGFWLGQLVSVPSQSSPSVKGHGSGASLAALSSAVQGRDSCIMQEQTNKQHTLFVSHASQKEEKRKEIMVRIVPPSKQ